jgi:hypothetical protein
MFAIPNFYFGLRLPFANSSANLSILPLFTKLMNNFVHKKMRMAITALRIHYQLKLYMLIY